MRTVFLSVSLFVFFINYALAAPQQLEKQVEVTEKVKSVTGETIEAGPKYWRAILGDICQLPSFPRATGDPTRYIECAKSGVEASNRKDLGIWLLRECLPNYEFVASARRCKTVRSVRRQQQICDGPNASNYQFCPAKQQNDLKFVVREIRQAPMACACPNGEQNCVCASPEILEPMAVVSAPVPTVAPVAAPVAVTASTVSEGAPVANDGTTVATPATAVLADGTVIEESSVILPDAPRALAQTYGQCPCPVQMPNCICQPAPIAPQCQTTTTQQQYCPQPQNPVVMPQPCPLVQGGVQNAQYQGICSWMIDPLAADPTSRNCFLQCQPAPNNLFCGRWQRMPCAPATIFDVGAQVCVWDPNAQPGPLPAPQPYSATGSSQCGCSGGMQIGSCNQNFQCPGQSVCQVAQPSCPVCCYFHKKKQL